MHPPHSKTRAGIHRRDFLKSATLAFATSVMMPRALQAIGSVPSSSSLITKKIPRAGEEIPAIGLGTFLTFDVIPGRPREHLREVIRRYWEGGARVIDTSPLYGTAELSVGDFAASLGLTDQMFASNKIWSTGEFLADESHARRSLEQSLQRLWRGHIDLMHCHSLVNVDIIVPYLQAWKKEGLIRYVGVSHHENAYMAPLASWVQRGAVDIVQVNYSIFNRAAEERVLPAAADQGVGVLVNMPLEKARLHKVVEGRPLPDFAREIGIENWSQYFLKWVISHPAVTCALPSTSNPAHASENIGALRGPLPDESLRARMVRHMESIPGFQRIAEMPWYPDKNYTGIIGRARAALNART